MNRSILGLLIIFLTIPNWFVVNWLFHNLDYCVTHACGVTHNFGMQDAIWTFYPILSMLTIICLGVCFVYLDIRVLEVR